MPIVMLGDTAECETFLLVEAYLKLIDLNLNSSAFWGFRRHFPDLADNLFGSLDPSTQRSVDKERDGGSSGGVSMSASLRGSNTSLNSMPGGVLSM